MNPKQSNTQEGLVSIQSGEDLTGKESFLVVLGSSGGVAVANRPTAITELTPYVVEEGAANGENSILRPLDPNRNVRVKAEGTGSAGDVVVMADPAVDADKGMVRALPAAAATYLAVGVAEEDFVDGQLVKIRPVGQREIVVV